MMIKRKVCLYYNILQIDCIWTSCEFVTVRVLTLSEKKGSYGLVFTQSYHGRDLIRYLIQIGINA